MPHQNTHPKAVALREAAHDFAKHNADDHDDIHDKLGMRLNAALLAAALDYARAVDRNFHTCTKCDKPVAPKFTGQTSWCVCRPRGGIL